MQQQLKKSIITLCGRDNISALHKISEQKTILDTIKILTFYFLNFLCLIYSYKLSYLLSFFLLPLFMMINSIVFNWINVQCHEASHKLLFNNKKINDRYFNYILGFFCFHDVDTYRLTHRNHHDHLHSDKDPDLRTYTEHANHKSFLNLILLDMLGITAFKKIFEIIETRNYKSNMKLLFFKILYQLIILLILVYFTNIIFGLIFFFFMQIYSLFCIFPILIRIRTIVQHYHPSISDLNNKNNEIWISRSTQANLLERVILGARMDYHFEHHLFPMIPHYNIKKLNFLLEKKNFFKSSINSNFLTNNFFDFFKKSIAS